MRPILWVIGLALLPAELSGQIMRGVTEVPIDTARHGLFFELGGPGELYSLSYERRLRPRTVAQIGFTRWSFHFLSPRRLTRAGIGTLFYQLPVGDLNSEQISLEFGGGFVAGKHGEEQWPTFSAEDTLAAMNPPPPTLKTSPWIALTGLAGLRFEGINGGMTYRLGWTPMMRMRDLPAARRYVPGFGMSIGYTW